MTPKEWCSVQYNDLDEAIANCLQLKNNTEMIFLGKTDLSSAFHILPLRKDCFCWLVMKAEDPADGKFKYFVEKCLPFGSSISCSHYQRFSNALKHIMTWQHGIKDQGKAVTKAITNYHDDFLFLAITKLLCDGMIWGFMQLCDELNIPITKEKTEWGCTTIIGILLDRRNFVLSLPVEKQIKALHLLNDLKDK